MAITNQKRSGTAVDLRRARLVPFPERVEMGGHHVPEPVVRRRYLAGLSNFEHLFRNAVDSWQVFDNSTMVGPRLIAAGVAGEPIRILDPGTWTNLKEKLG